MKAGTLLALRLYGEKDESTEREKGKKRKHKSGELNQPERDINKLRYQHYVRQIGNSKLVTNLKRYLRSVTSETLKQHIFRVYHAVQQFMGNELPATNWGWIKNECTLYPVLTDKAIAPDNLLELISCGCKSNCTGNCGCRNISMNCTTMCKECHGRKCSNIPKEGDDDSID